MTDSINFRASLSQVDQAQKMQQLQQQSADAQQLRSAADAARKAAEEQRKTPPADADTAGTAVRPDGRKPGDGRRDRRKNRKKPEDGAAPADGHIIDTEA